MASTISGSTGVTADTLVSTGTGALTLPVGTTAQRPASPATGQLRFNTTLGYTEIYNGTVWIGIGGYLVSYLILSGGGSGGGNSSGNAYVGGGGGGGGLITGSVQFKVGDTYVATVGAGGAQTLGAGTNGSPSSIPNVNLASLGGGRGGSWDVPTGTAGGSGGGGAGRAATETNAGGAGTSGQGFAGGTGRSDASTPANIGGGGGGGASAVGANSPSSGVGGAGGAGGASSITGSSINYGGGGGGGAASTAGAGGSGGGGAGAIGGNGINGTANLGGGGGGGAAYTGGSNYGGNGGSGVVIFSIPTANYTGTTTGSPVVTTSGSNTILKFNASGTYTA